MSKYIVFVFCCLYGFALGGDMDCPKNCVFKKCADPCPKTCEHLFKDVKCFNKKKCSPGCECADGFILKHGDCVEVGECYKDKCGSADVTYSQTPCSHTCANMFQNVSCEAKDRPGCQCAEGYFLNTQNKCVANKDCSVEEVICPDHASFAVCATSCPATCGNMHLENICNELCNVRCECDAGYVLNSLHECVAPDSCEPEEVVCPIKGQEFSGCGVTRSCDTLYDVIKTPCEPGCYCPSGTVLDTNTNTCIACSDCPNSLENQACRRIDANMIFYGSHVACKATCKNPEPTCDEQNISGCFCIKGYVWNHKHMCIPVDECCKCADY